MTRKEKIRYRLKCLYNRWGPRLHLGVRLLRNAPVFEVHFPLNQKWCSCVISKNGCSSILSSILKYDDGEVFDENVKIWKQDDMRHIWGKHIITFDSASQVDRERFAGCRKFVILRDPFDRFISFINNSHKEEEYDCLFDKSLSPERYVDSVLRSYPYMIRHTDPDRRYDKHAIPQRVYYEEYRRLFGDELEVVMISDLPDYFKELTGSSLVRNNVTRSSEKVCTRESLTPRQKRTIEKYIRRYEFCKDDEYTRIFEIRRWKATEE